MNLNYVKSVVAAGALAFGGVAQASSVNDFTSFWVLGDSLSAYAEIDTNNDGDVDTTVQASDGPVWAKDILDQFDVSGNFARGGSSIALSPTSPNYLVDQALQLAATPRSAEDDNPLVAIWMGGNDIIPGVFSTAATGFDETALQVVATQLAAIYSGVIETVLKPAGFDTFALFEVPDVGDTPRVQEDFPLLAEGATKLSGFFNDALRMIEIEGVDISIIDVFDVSQNSSIIPGVLERGPCLGDENIDCETAAYWDSFHPTGTVHQFFEGRFREELHIADVPLPAAGWMLLAGLGGLGLMRRRAA